EGARCWRHHLKGLTVLFGFSESGAHCLRASSAPNCQLNGATGGNLMNHAAKLSCTFDALPVDFRHYIVFLESGLGRRAVGNNSTQNYATFGRKFKLLGFVGGHFMGLDAEPARAIVTHHDLEFL